MFMNSQPRQDISTLPLTVAWKQTWPHVATARYWSMTITTLMNTKRFA